MEAGNQALNGLIREISRQWHDLALPPVTDWDLFETLLETTRCGRPDAHASAPVTMAALLAARSKLAQSGVLVCAAEAGMALADDALGAQRAKTLG